MALHECQLPSTPASLSNDGNEGRHTLIYKVGLAPKFGYVKQPEQAEDRNERDTHARSDVEPVRGGVAIDEVRDDPGRWRLQRIARIDCVLELLLGRELRRVCRGWDGYGRKVREFGREEANEARWV